jgi:hypothetical protein
MGRARNKPATCLFQLIHQGTKLIPIRLYWFYETVDMDHHNVDVKFCPNGGLMHGKSKEQVQSEFEKQQLTKTAAFLLPFFYGQQTYQTI